MVDSIVEIPLFRGVNTSAKVCGTLTNRIDDPVEVMLIQASKIRGSGPDFELMGLARDLHIEIAETEDTLLAEGLAWCAEHEKMPFIDPLLKTWYILKDRYAVGDYKNPEIYLPEPMGSNLIRVINDQLFKYRTSLHWTAIIPADNVTDLFVMVGWWLRYGGS